MTTILYSFLWISRLGKVLKINHVGSISGCQRRNRIGLTLLLIFISSARQKIDEDLAKLELEIQTHESRGTSGKASAAADKSLSPVSAPMVSFLFMLKLTFFVLQNVIFKNFIM